MAEDTRSFDIDQSSVQIAPNASAQYTTIQNFYGAEYSKYVLNAKHCNQESIAEGAIANMFYYSATKPCPIANEVFRKAELAMCEKRLAEDKVLCLYGEDGVGVTTLLAQFAREHGENCVSYFYNGLDIMLLNPEIMEHSIVEQLYWYVKGKDASFNMQEVASAPITALWSPVYRKIKQSSEPLYFVFDGFDSIPLEKVESVKRVLEKMFWGNGRFIFSGTKEKIKKLILSSVKLTIHEHEILTLSDAEVKDFFRKSIPGIKEEDLESLCKITRGLGERIDAVLHLWVKASLSQFLSLLMQTMIWKSCRNIFLSKLE